MVVAKLPFEPVWFVKSLSHRNLEGEDLTDCSFIFLYVLMGMVYRNNVAKIFGFEGPQNLYTIDPVASYKWLINLKIFYLIQLYIKSNIISNGLKSDNKR